MPGNGSRNSSAKSRSSGCVRPTSTARAQAETSRSTGRSNRWCLESEIAGLADLHAYMKYQNYVTRFSFPYFDMPEVAEGFELRERPDDKLPYDPARVQSSEPNTELKQVPEDTPTSQPNTLPVVQQIEPEPAVAPDADEQQNLITRG